MLRKFKFHENLKIITSTSHKDLGTFILPSRLILLRMRNVSTQVAEKTKIHIFD